LPGGGVQGEAEASAEPSDRHSIDTPEEPKP
jgi:hypothetical protein